MSIKEFREKGYLQELNRQFLHPFGLALEIVIEPDGEEKLSSVWDCREDKEGIIYDINNSDEERKAKFKIKKENIENELKLRNIERKKTLGYIIEPIN